MFGLAIHDRVNNRLVLARDHFGIKPLYYATAGTTEAPTLLFGSEIKPLLAANKLESGVNERILFRYLQFRIHDDEPATFFAGVQKLMPGEKLVLNTENASPRVCACVCSRKCPSERPCQADWTRPPS